MSTTTQVSAYISEETKAEVEAYVKRRGVKKAYLIEQALQHHLQALREIPEDLIIPSRLVLTETRQGRCFIISLTWPHRAETYYLPCRETDMRSGVARRWLARTFQEEGLISVRRTRGTVPGGGSITRKPLL